MRKKNSTSLITSQPSTVEIRMLKTYVGSLGIFRQDEIHKVLPVIATSWVRDGVAKFVDDIKPDNIEFR